MRQNHNTTRQATVTCFALGQTFITPEPKKPPNRRTNRLEFLRRHMSCDFGDSTWRVAKSFSCKSSRELSEIAGLYDGAEIEGGLSGDLRLLRLGRDECLAQRKHVMWLGGLCYGFVAFKISPLAG